MTGIAVPERIADPARAAGARRLLALSRLDRGRVWLVVAIAIYIGFACFLTWPMVAHLGSVFYAENPPGDAIGGMTGYRELVDHHHNPFLAGMISQLAAPEGQTIAWARNLAQLPSVLSQFLLTAGFGQITGYDLYLLLGYVLSATVMFLFVRKLTGNPWAALISGWAFAFFPFAVLNGQGHNDFIHGWVLVLPVWAITALHARPSARRAVVAGLAVVLSMWWTAYFILIGGVLYVAAVAASLAISVYDRQVVRFVRLHAITAGIVGLFAAFLAWLSQAQPGVSLTVRTNDLSQFNAYSARPLEYVLPDAHSPLFGRYTSSYLTSHLHGSDPVEATLYLGITILALALAAAVYLLLRRLGPRLSRATVILITVGIVCLLVSAPPEAKLFGLTIPFPSHFIMRATTTWRVYSRFVIVVMLAAAALAGIGLNALTRGRRTSIRVAAMIVASVLVPLDLWARLPAHTPAISRTVAYTIPPVYTVLARQSPGLVAEYPLTPAGANFYTDIFYENVYGMPLINGYDAGSIQEKRALSLANLADPTTGPRLASLGVRYVVLEAGPTPYGYPPAGTPGRGFNRLYTDVHDSLYRVTSRPLGPALATVDSSFGGDEAGPHGTVFNWLEQPSGRIELAGNCHRCAGVLEMTLASFARRRLVTISVAGRVLARRSIGKPVRFAIPLVAGQRWVTIAATPGPQSIAATIGGTDTRDVSIQVTGLKFSWPPRRGSVKG